MRSRDISLKEYAISQTKSTGVVPCIKLHEKDDWLKYAQAMYDGGARVIEVTMTTPGVLEAIEAISSHFGDQLLVAAGTVLDPISAREVILHGGSVIVNPCVVPDVIDLAGRYNVPVSVSYTHLLKFWKRTLAKRNMRLALKKAMMSSQKLSTAL